MINYINASFNIVMKFSLKAIASIKLMNNYIN